MVPFWLVGCMIIALMIVYYTAFRIIEKNHEKEIKLMEKMFRSYESAVDTSLMRLEDDIDELIESIKSGGKDDNISVCESVEEDDIHLISAEEFYFTRRDYEKERFMYKPEDNTLRYLTEPDDERNLIINNPVDYLGEGLRFFGVRSNDPKTVYIRNNKLKTDFRVWKLECYE